MAKQRSALCRKTGRNKLFAVAARAAGVKKTAMSFAVFLRLLGHELQTVLLGVGRLWAKSSGRQPTGSDPKRTFRSNGISPSFNLVAHENRAWTDPKCNFNNIFGRSKCVAQMF
jgi:hypothetical protein